MAFDVGTNTVMSYDSVTRATTLGPLDIVAVQAIYGLANADGTQNASWSWNPATETLTQTGTAAEEFIRGTSANDIIFSMGGRDAIVTDQGNDKVILTGQVASENGGTGLDTVVTGFAYAESLVMGGDNATEFHWISMGADFMTFVQVKRSPVHECDHRLRHRHQPPRGRGLSGLPGGF